ncbi:hypothetical protein [Chelativorans intermedius]|uniref:Uncharacterized protein n=1 Tax=Chelativorans intermedius TaxID=515947 RepID=A0ABV6DC65_9HYPH|nr:hypothetical protein [Chelativorans intermedius]MCT8999628.1 hypothetical protein [Chelativorans intermedius]
MQDTSAVAAPAEDAISLVLDARDQLTAVGDLVNLLYHACEGLTGKRGHAITRGCYVVSNELEKAEALLDTALSEFRGERDQASTEKSTG